MTKFIQELGESVKAYGKAHRLIARQRWWGWLFLPGLVHLLLLILMIILAWTVSDNILLYLYELFGVQQALNDLPWIQVVLRFLLTWTIRAMLVGLYLLLFKQLIVIILAPIFAYLSERTERQLTGQTYSFRLSYFLKDVWRGILLGLRNFGIEILWMFGMFLLSFIPIVGLVSPVVIFLVESYFLGFSMVDYYLERQRLSVRQSARLVWAHKGFAFGIGAGFFGLMLIPVIGWMIAPIYAVIAGTIGIHEIESNNEYIDI